MKSCVQSDSCAQVQWVRNRWRHFWFALTTPTNLGVCRCLFCGYLWWLSLGMDSRPWAEIAPVFWMPTALFAWLSVPVGSREMLELLDLCWRIALVLSCLGLLTAVSTGVAFLLGVYLLGLPQNFGKIDHSTGLLVIILGILWLSPCGRGWSLDQWVRKAWLPREPWTHRSCSASGEYQWPVQLVRVAMALVFFGAGVAKLQYGGLGWISAENMRTILLLHHYNIDRELSALGLYIAESGWLCWWLAAATVGVEVGAPLALVSRRVRLLVLPGLFLMQLGNAVLLGVHASFPFAACYAFWVPWDRLGKRGLLFLSAKEGPNSAP